MRQRLIRASIAMSLLLFLATGMTWLRFEIATDGRGDSTIANAYTRLWYRYDPPSCIVDQLTIIRGSLSPGRSTLTLSGPQAELGGALALVKGRVGEGSRVSCVGSDERHWFG